MWSLEGSQAFDQRICGFGPGWPAASLSAALGLSGVHGRSVALGLSCAWQSFCYFGSGLRSAGRCAALGLWVGQLASAPSAHPLEVSIVGALPGFQVWAPSPLIWVCTTGLQVSAGAVYPVFTIQGLRGEGRQRPWLLPEFCN